MLAVQSIVEEGTFWVDMLYQPIRHRFGVGGKHNELEMFAIGCDKLLDSGPDHADSPIIPHQCHLQPQHHRNLVGFDWLGQIRCRWNPQILPGEHHLTLQQPLLKSGRIEASLHHIGKVPFNIKASLIGQQLGGVHLFAQLLHLVAVLFHRVHPTQNFEGQCECSI